MKRFAKEAWSDENETTHEGWRLYFRVEAYNVVNNENKFVKVYGNHVLEISMGQNVKDPITQAYDHLKTLPEYSNATDV